MKTLLRGNVIVSEWNSFNLMMIFLPIETKTSSKSFKLFDQNSAWVSSRKKVFSGLRLQSCVPKTGLSPSFYVSLSIFCNKGQIWLLYSLFGHWFGAVWNENQTFSSNVTLHPLYTYTKTKTKWWRRSTSTILVSSPWKTILAWNQNFLRHRAMTHNNDPRRRCKSLHKRNRHMKKTKKSSRPNNLSEQSV